MIKDIQSTVFASNVLTKCAINLHLTCTKKYYLCIKNGATIVVPNSTFRRCSFGIFFKNYVTKFTPNIIKICPK